MNLSAGLSRGGDSPRGTQSTNYNLNTYENEPLFECAGAPAQIREDRAGSAARPAGPQKLYESGAEFAKDIDQTMSPLMSVLLTIVLPMLIFIGLGQCHARSMP